MNLAIGLAVFVALWWIGFWWLVWSREQDIRLAECQAWERIEMARIADDKKKRETSAIGFHAERDDNEDDDAEGADGEEA